MKKIIAGSIFLLVSFQAMTATQAEIGKDIEIAVVSSVNSTDFESQIMPFFKEQIKRCTTCRIKNISPYKKDGSLDVAQIATAINQARSSASFLYMHWNAKLTEETKAVADALKSSVGEGFVVVGAAGMAAPHEPTLPLNKTVLGNVPGLVIIGDLEARERLPVKSFFGPEMLTAVRAPEEFVGKSFGSVIFVGRLAMAYYRKSSGKDWLDHFNMTKTKTRALWPRLDEFFGR